MSMNEKKSRQLDWYRCAANDMSGLKLKITTKYSKKEEEKKLMIKPPQKN